jgi:hypothetical protein
MTRTVVLDGYTVSPGDDPTTLHVAWTGLSARRRLLGTTVAHVRALLEGAPIHVLNPAYAKARR